jgi:HD-GYP domain-containing protein (c-di-GMP phosphodiesterase class II)
MRTHPLRTFVRRVLVVRLGIATAIIAVAVAAAAYVTQKARLANDVADLGRRGVATLVERVRSVMDREGADVVSALREVVGRGEQPVVYRAGRFVLFQVYDRSSTVLVEGVAGDQLDIAQIRTFMASQPLAFPAAGQDHVQAARINDGLLVYTVIPIVDRAGSVAAFARGMFAVSPEVAEQMRWTILLNVFLAVAIVVCVAALLFPVILHLTRRLADYSTHLLEANLETLAVLGSAIAKRDSDTDAHNYRVSLYSARIGQAMGLGRTEMQSLVKGAFLHDVGKLGIPDAILLKPGRLDDGEFTVMQSHVEKGVDIVQRSSWLRDGIAVAGYHHEKYGGGGYPHNLRGEDIPIAARIFAVADVFDALTSARPYKKPLDFDEAMDLLEQGRGGHFDPTVLNAFAKIARRLYDRYAGREGEDLRNELAALVEEYFSAGIETLRYGDHR